MDEEEIGNIDVPSTSAVENMEGNHGVLARAGPSNSLAMTGGIFHNSHIEMIQKNTHNENKFILLETSGGRDLSNLVEKIGLNKDQHKLNVPAAETLTKYGFPTNLVEMIGRDREARELDTQLKCNQQVAIVGMGGSGKTTLSYDCAQRWAARDYTTILINSETEESVISSLRGLALELRIDHKDKQPTTLVQIIWKFFKNINVLIIYDNVELFETIRDYLPPLSNKNFFVIITSQNEEHPEFKIFRLKILNDNEAMKLINAKCHKWNPGEQLEDVKQLIKETQGLPLAIIQAVSYINFKYYATNKHSIGSYLESYKNNLLNMEKTSGFNTIDSYKKTVYTAVMMNIELMKKHDHFKEDMFKLLHVMSFLNPEYIRTDLLMELCGVNERDLNDFITISKICSLCKQVERWGQEYLDIHRLVLEVSGRLIDQRYETDLLMNIVKFFIVKYGGIDLMWNAHRDFIFRHLTVEGFHKICVSLFSEPSLKTRIKNLTAYLRRIKLFNNSDVPHKQPSKEYFDINFQKISLKNILDRLKLNINNLTVYHYGAYFGVINLFNNIKIFYNKNDGDVPSQITSLKQLFEERKSLKINSVVGCESWISCQDGRVLMELADEYHHMELIQKLIKQGAFIVDAPYTMFYFNDTDGKLKYMIGLLDGSTDLSSGYNTSQLLSESHQDVKQQYISQVLNEGGSVNNTDRLRMTPLYVATKIGRIDWIKVLLDNGADVNAADNEGRTLVHLTAIDRNDKCITSLLTDKTNINISDKHGWTALHHAVISRSLECVRALVAHGARADVKDKCGKTPLDHAKEWDHSECITLLSETTTSTENVGEE